ncbi:MAG: hypothetical protein QOK31_2193 [Solirubrobacteraceae bacterium]|jgi:hypothetical protein|nr:hypothetical protein [Solirubrobacteraceae bacterium]
MLRRSLRPVAPALIMLAALAVGGCGGKDKSAAAQALLDQTFKGGHRVDSGRLLADVAIDQQSSGGGGAVTLQLAGPFERGSAGSLPKLDLAFKGRQPKRTIDVGLVSTGTQLFIRRSGQAYVLPDVLAAFVRQGYAQQSAQGGNRPLLDRLGVAVHWLRDPRIVGDADVAGAATTHITSGVDVAALLGDLNRLAQRAKSLPLPTGSVPGLGEQERRKLVDAVKSATVDVFTGKADKTLRRFVVKLRIEIPPAQRGASGLRSIDVALSIELAALNQPQSITAPAGARPISQLPGGASGALGLGSGGGGSAPAPAPSPGGGAQSGYARCIARAGNDIVKAQRCITLLGK